MGGFSVTRVSHHLQSASEETEELVENDVPLMGDYGWVDVRVCEYFSKHRWLSMLQSFVSSVDILDKNMSEDIVSLHKCKATNIVCHR